MHMLLEIKPQILPFYYALIKHIGDHVIKSCIFSSEYQSHYFGVTLQWEADDSSTSFWFRLANWHVDVMTTNCSG